MASPTAKPPNSGPSPQDARSAGQDVASAPDDDRPTDLDPEEAEVAREEFQAITDGTLTIGALDMDAYYRLVSWVESQSFVELEGRAAKGVRYADLHDHPNRYRGRLVVLDLELVRAQDSGPDPNNRLEVPLCEVSGVTDDSRPSYNLLVVGYPTDMAKGPVIRERARFAGYFFKLQGNLPHDARPVQRVERIPLLIGRLRWEPPVTPKPDPLEWILGAVLVAAIAVFLVGRLFWRSSKGRQRRSTAAAEALGTKTPPTSEANPVDAWLQRAEQGEFDDPADETRP